MAAGKGWPCPLPSDPISDWGKGLQIDWLTGNQFTPSLAYVSFPTKSRIPVGEPCQRCLFTSCFLIQQYNVRPLPPPGCKKEANGSEVKTVRPNYILEGLS